MMEVKNTTLSFLKNQAGMSVIEILVASVIVVTVALGMAATFNSVGKTREKSDVVVAALAIESVIDTGFTDTDNISVGLLADGNIDPTAATYTFNGSWGTTPVTTLTFNAGHAADGTPGYTYFDKNFGTCSSFANKDCAIKVNLSIRMAGGRLGFAYSIDFNPLLGGIASLGGVDENTGASYSKFTDDYYYTSIPDKHATNCKGAACATAPTTVTACNPATDMGAYQVDLINRTVSCLNLPTQCPNAEAPSDLFMMAKGIRVTPSGSTLSAAMNCTGFKKAKCPTNYGLSRIRLSSLEDTSSAPDGTCLYATMDSGSTTISGTHVVGQVCPNGYKSVSTCDVVMDSGSQGTCPDGSINDPFTGVASFSQNDESVDCRLMAPTVQPCGAYWSGHIRVNVNCAIQTGFPPKTMPATF